MKLAIFQSACTFYIVRNRDFCAHGFIKDQAYNKIFRVGRARIGKWGWKVKVSLSRHSHESIFGEKTRSASRYRRKEARNGAASTLFPAVATRKRNFLLWRFHTASAFSLRPALELYELCNVFPVSRISTGFMVIS